ncbi:MAG: ATP-binding cassette domain-containing protein, partial [Oscillospiraceae bacterium]
PQGIETPFDNKSFSFGQRQLLSIARAVVTMPPILLLDEMSANLDAQTEKQILNILESISQSHTIISISHRLTTALKNNRAIDISKS